MRVLSGLILAVGLATVSGLAGQSRRDDPDLDRFQGKWKVLEAEVDGKPLRLDKITIARYSFSRYKLVTTRGGKKIEKTIRIDSKKSPKTIDITFDASKVGGKKDEVWPGIYRFGGGSLRICFNNQGNKRPSKFKTTARSGLIMMVLVRDRGR